MIGLRIECSLATPWSPPAFGLHLDGLIGWALVEQHRRADMAARGVHDEPPAGAALDYPTILAGLPLQKDEATGAWCASQFFPVGWRGQERRYYTAKTPVEDMSRRINEGLVDTKGGAHIDTQRGPAKNSQGFITIEHVEGLRAWCVGDPDEIVQLLSTHVHHVGVKSRIGLGTLLEQPDGSLWRIEEDAQAFEMWKHRSMPAKVLDDSRPAIGSWKPPYWRGQDVIWRPNVVRLPGSATSTMGHAA
ncbi:MAG: type IV CRISPR-associated protein Csf3 [Polaromonas sp.]|nr:type IV CRISPR-associated protein Csf3 [Polaromonas sp.]